MVIKKLLLCSYFVSSFRLCSLMLTMTQYIKEEGSCKRTKFVLMLTFLPDKFYYHLSVKDYTGLNLQWCPLSSGCWQLFTPLAQSVWGSTYSGCRSPQIEAWKKGSQYLSCTSRSNCMIFIFNATASTSWLPAPPCFLHTASCSWACFQNLSMLLVMVSMMRMVMVKKMLATKRMEWKDDKWQWR